MLVPEDLHQFDVKTEGWGACGLKPYPCVYAEAMFNRLQIWATFIREFVSAGIWKK